MLSISNLLKMVPDDLACCADEPSAEEVEHFVSTRKRYAEDISKALPEADKIRAFRLLNGKRKYLEVGTFDKFNLRYCTDLLGENALVVDLDIKENKNAEEMLRSEIPLEVEYISIIGDSAHSATQQKVIAASPDGRYDVIFIDGNHMASYVMSDFALYGELVAEDGYVLFHDVCWEGGAFGRGVADAIETLQRFVPVYQILGGHPVSHWYRALKENPNAWGGVAVIRGSDLHNALNGGSPA